MSPRPRDNPLLQDDDNDFTLVGSIEVVSDGRTCRVQCVPVESESDFVSIQQKDDIVERRHEDDDEPLMVGDEEGVEYGLLETLSMACANTCSCQCTPYLTKSILKTGKPDNPEEDGPTTIQQRHQVSFSQHEIHEFDLTLGHHPSAIHGPPVMLDYQSEGTNRVVGVDEYEKQRGPPRSRRQLKINPHERKHILTQEKGFSEAEVYQAWAEAITIRRQRQETNNRGSIMMLYDDFSESMSRKYNRLLGSIGLQ